MTSDNCLFNVIKEFEHKVIAKGNVSLVRQKLRRVLINLQNDVKEAQIRKTGIKKIETRTNELFHTIDKMENCRNRRDGCV